MRPPGLPMSPAVKSSVCSSAEDPAPRVTWNVVHAKKR